MEKQQPTAATVTKLTSSGLIRRLICFTALLSLSVSVCGYVLRRSSASAVSESRAANEKEAGWSLSPAQAVDLGGADMMSMFVGAPAISDAAHGLIGLNGVSVGSTQALVDSFDSANGPYGPGNKASAAMLISNGGISVEGSKVYGDVRSTSSSVTLKRLSLVTGNVIAGTGIANGGTINGSATPNSPSAPVTAPAVAPCSPFSPANTIGGKFNYDAAKGDLTINGKNIATLAAGSYCFHNLTLAGGGRLTASGRVTVRLTGQFSAAGNSSSAADGGPGNLQILSSYAGSAGVTLSGTTELHMTIYAPQTDVSLLGSPRLYGSVLGKTLSLTGNASLHFDSRLATAINTAPIVNAGADQTIVLPAAATLSGSASDDGLPNPPAGLTYQWTQVSGPSAASIANSTQASTSTSFPVAGAYVFRLTASDGALSGSADVQVTAHPPVNQAPIVNAGSNQTITLPATATLTGSASDDGLPNPPGALTYLWSQSSGPAQASLANPTQPNTTVSFPVNGVYVFQFTVSDGVLGSNATLQVTVNPPVNQSPNVNAGADQTITLPANATLNGSATDDGLPAPPTALSTAWSQVAGPVPALVQAPSQAATTASFKQPGTYVLQLTANDGALISSATTQITVLDGPPTLAPLPDRTIPSGSKYSVRLSAEDPNTNDTLSYFLDSAPAGASLSLSRAVVWTPTSAQLGINEFTVRVVDAAGHSDNKTFRITVEAANYAPQLAEQADERVPSGGGFSRALGATDPDGDALAYALVSGPAGLTISGSQLSWNPVAATPGDYSVTVKVADPAGLIDSKRFNVSVYAASASAVRDDSYEVSLGQALAVPAPGVLANDADPNGGALTAAKLTDPDKGAVSAFNADGSFTYAAPPTTGGPVLDMKRVGAFRADSVGAAPPLVADVDGDGKPDIITNEWSGPLTTLRVSRGDTGAHIFSFDTLPPAQVGGMDCKGYGGGQQTFAAADIDDDGRIEIVRGINCGGWPTSPDKYTRIVAVAYDASLPEHFRVKWLSEPIVSDTSVNVPHRSSFTVARLSPGDKPVVLLGGTTSGRCSGIRPGATDAACRGVWALDGGDGSLKRVYYSAPTDQSSVSGVYTSGHGLAGAGGFMAPVVADVDNDGVPEILYEGTLWDIDGTVKRQFDGTANSATQSSVVVDLDGDAQVEVVTLDNAFLYQGAGLLRAWKAGGQLIWQVPLPRSGVATKLSVADVDRDGGPDFVFGIWNTIWVIDRSGHIKWLRDMSGPTDGFNFQFGQSTSYPVNFPVYDLNGDGTPEMIVAYGSNTLRFLRADTGEDTTSWTHPESPVWRNAFGIHSPVVADVDGSGHASLVFLRDPAFFCGGCEGLIQILRGDTAAWQPAATHYNQQAYWETNFNADGSVPATYTRHTADPRTNVFGQQPQAPYASGFVPPTETSFTYAATNAAGLSSTATVNIHIAPQNHPPKFTSKPPSAYLGYYAGQTVVDYQARAVDPDPGDTVTYRLAARISDHAEGSVNPNTGLAHLYRLHFGEHTFVITATDSHGASAVQTIILRQAAGTTSVPGLVGMTQTDAASSLTAAQLLVGEITNQHTSAPAGTVLGQSPAAGTALLQGEVVDLTVSLGPASAVVPNVVGSTRTAALTALSGGGFTAAVTQVFSDAVPAGTVMAQSPAAGTFVAPTPANPVALTVSAGTGLSLSLTRSVTTADQSITVTPTAFEVSGNPVSVPALTYTIKPKQTPFAGTLPILSGTTITPGLDTLGSFTITATDAANSRSVSADFAVLPPRDPGTVNNGESFAHMAEVLEQIHSLREPLKAALAANDTAQMTALLQQTVTLWRTVDLDDLRISQPLAPTEGFAPTVEMMKSFGHSATPDDVISQQVLKDSIEDLTAWTNGLKSSSVSIAQLNVMGDRFSTRAARMDGLVISRYGGINNKSQYTRLLTRAIPDYYEALTNELALLTGMPVREPSFPFLAQDAGGSTRGALSTLPELARSAAKPRRVKGLKMHHATRAAALQGTLAELNVTMATQYVVDKLMEPYNNAKKYATHIVAQAAWTAAAVKLTSELRQFLEGQELVAVVAGASLSFREFQSAPSWIETYGNDDPSLNVVMVIGPDLVVQAADLYQKVKNGYNKTSSTRYKNADDVKKGLGDLQKSFKAAKSSLDKLKEQADRAFQSPDEVMNGCLFTADPKCRQLLYHNGFQPVYTYSPPPGFQSLGGLPVAIIVIVYDAGDGGMSFGTPSFLPCTYVDDDHNPNTPKKIQCPNNPPITP